MKNKPFIPGTTLEEVSEQIAELQSDIQIIDQQLNSRNLEIKEMKSDGLATKESIFEFNRWRSAACKAKTIKMSQLRQLKTIRKNMNTSSDNVYKSLGYYLQENLPNGSIHKDEAGVYFVFAGEGPENVTDYFPTMLDLVEYLKGIERAEGDDTSENDNEEWED